MISRAGDWARDVIVLPNDSVSKMSFLLLGCAGGGNEPSSYVPDLYEAVFSSQDDFVEPCRGMENGSDVAAFIQIQRSNEFLVWYVECV
jgi:hypothetical protein